MTKQRGDSPDTRIDEPGPGLDYIHRFLDNLVERGDTVSSPLPVRRGFAKHLQRYLLVPSSRYAAPGARKAKGELTGCLLYDQPAEILWEVSQ